MTSGPRALALATVALLTAGCGANRAWDAFLAADRAVKAAYNPNWKRTGQHPGSRGARQARQDCLARLAAQHGSAAFSQTELAALRYYCARTADRGTQHLEFYFGQAHEGYLRSILPHLEALASDGAQDTWVASRLVVFAKDNLRRVKHVVGGGFDNWARGFEGPSQKRKDSMAQLAARAEKVLAALAVPEE